MKKIHDIKKRAPKKTEPTQESNWLDSFWHGVSTASPANKRKNYRIPISGKKLVLSAFLVAFIMTATGRAYVVKAELSDSVREAKVHLNSAITSLDYGEYDKALDECSEAKAEIDKIKLNLQAWGQNSQYLQMIDYRSDIVSAETLVSSTDSVLNIANTTKSLIEEMSGDLGGQSLTLGEEINFKLRIEKLQKSLDENYSQTSDLQKTLAKQKTNDSIISSVDRQKILDAFNALGQQIKSIRENVIPLINWYAGVEDDRNIMLLLQNNAELRGSGGFIGSYAIIHTHKSSIARIDFQTNIYKLDNAVKGKLGIAAPPEFDVLSQGNLYLRDANYAVDGPESLSTVVKMYKLESGNSLDGIIAIDTSFITSLLEITGPIEMPEYNMKVTADNFLTEVQSEVEINYFQRQGGKIENEPKKILAQMMPRMLTMIMAGMKSPEKRTAILKVLKDAISAKHFLMYSTEPGIQSKIESFNLGGKIAAGNFDYFISHSTNIGGGKSSLNINERVDDVIEIQDDGKVVHHVTIERKHTGNGKFPDYDNLNLVRILFPTGTNVSDFRPIMGNFWPHMDKKRSKEVDHYGGTEAGKDKLSFWMNTKSGDVSKVSFTYTSGYKISLDKDAATYKLYLQKQAGTKSADYNITVKYPESWAYMANYVHSDLQYDLNLDKDKLLELKFEL